MIANLISQITHFIAGIIDYLWGVAQSSGFSLLNTFLLILSILLATSTYLDQKSTSMRSSLEQLDDYMWGHFKIKPILSDFHYIRGKTTIQYQILTTGDPSKPTSLSQNFNDKNHDYLVNELCRIEMASDVVIFEDKLKHNKFMGLRSHIHR